MTTTAPSLDAELREILTRVRRIAVLGIKAGPAEEAFRVPLYLKQTGYEIAPVNPHLDHVLDQSAVGSLLDVAGSIDLIDVFRAPAHVPAHTDEILALDTPPQVVWLQLGIRDDASASRLEAAGIRVIQDRCIMVDHKRLIGPPSP